MIRPFRFLGAKSTPCINCTEIMGTVLYQEIYGINGTQIAEKVHQNLIRLENQWSPYKAENVVSQINQAAGNTAIIVDPDTINILSLAKKISIISQGAFDITVFPLIQLWRKAARMKIIPQYKELEKAKSLVCFQDLTIQSDIRVFLQRNDQGIDLGGIGKGFAADRAREIYCEAGIRYAVINLGGNVLVLNSKPDGSHWRIGIKNPGSQRRNYRIC